MIVSQYMTKEHRECDESFARAEKAAIEGDFATTKAEFNTFVDDTLKHFQKEEEVLFPAFESVTGSSEGPTNVMRFEHEQVRGLMGKMAQAIESEDKDAYLSLAESMMILLQQHNMKEEQMLYAMFDRVVPQEQKAQVLENIQAL